VEVEDCNPNFIQRGLLPDVEKESQLNHGRAKQSYKGKGMTVQRFSIGERVGKYFRKMFGDA
jgi:hypothetical protein